MAAPAKILKEALQLKPAQKAELVDELLSSLDQTDKAIRTQWAREAESRINAYERGKLKAVSIEKVLSKYK